MLLVSSRFTIYLMCQMNSSILCFSSISPVSSVQLMVVYPIAFLLHTRSQKFGSAFFLFSANSYFLRPPFFWHYFCVHKTLFYFWLYSCRYTCIMFSIFGFFISFFLRTNCEATACRLLSCLYCFHSIRGLLWHL